MFCASCERETRLTPCERCGQDPLLDGRFCLQAVVAQSANGRTWRAFHGAQRYAVKEYTLGTVDPATIRELVRHEMALLGRMDHRGVPRYREGLVAKIGAGQSLFMVQDFIDGHTLAEDLARKGKFDVVEVLDILEEIAGILVYLHGLTPPILHRDIHPGNVLRREDDDSLVLIDFAGIRDTLRDLDGRPGAGTVGYAAPEQEKGRVSPASDLYSLGAMAVRMLTGMEPKDLRDPSYQIRWADRCDAAASVQWLIQGLVEPNAAKRARNAQELLLRLRTVRGPKGSANKRTLSRTDAPSLSGRSRTQDHEPKRAGIFDDHAPIGQPLHEARTVLAKVTARAPTSEEAETELDLDDEDGNLSGLSDPYATRADSPEPDEDDALDRAIARRQKPAAPPRAPAQGVLPPPPPPKKGPQKPPPASGLGSAQPLSALPAPSLFSALPDEPMDPDEEPTIIQSRYTSDPAIAMITGATLVAEDDEELDIDEPPPPPPRTTPRASGWPSAPQTPSKPAPAGRTAPPPLPPGLKSVTLPPPEPGNRAKPAPERSRQAPEALKASVTTPPPEPAAPKTTPPPEPPKAKTTPPPEPPKAKTTPPPEPPGARTTPPPEPPKAKTTPPPEPARAESPLTPMSLPEESAANLDRPTLLPENDYAPSERQPAGERLPASKPTPGRRDDPPPIAAFAPPAHVSMNGPAPKAPRPNEPKGVIAGLEPRLPRPASISADPRSTAPRAPERSGPVVREKPAPPPEIREQARPSFEIRESVWTAPPPDPREERSPVVDDYFHRPVQKAEPTTSRPQRRDTQPDTAVADWRVDEMLRPARRPGQEESPVKAPAKKKRKKKRSLSTASLVLFVVLATLAALLFAAFLFPQE